MPREAAPQKSRADLLTEIAALPSTAFISPPQAAAYIDTTPSVLHCWRSQRRGPRYFGSNQFVRYRICDLDSWMATRSNEIIERPEGLFDTAVPMRLVWDQSEHTADQQQPNTE